MKHKVREWLRRYGPAELLSGLATLAAAGGTFRLTHHGVGTALAGTWGGNVAYFGYILAADIRLARRAVGLPYTGAELGQNIRALLAEFGVAELADSFLIRPALLYWLPKLLHSLPLGILLAKLSADVTFYVPVIIGYELSKKRLRRF